MATPLGHSLAGVAVAVLALPPPARGLRGLGRWIVHYRGPLFLLVLVANLSDVDYLPGALLGDVNRFHRGPSHSLAFAVAATLLVTLLARVVKLRTLPHPGRAVAAAALGHLLLDGLARDGRAPYGIPLGWPLSERAFQAPVTLFPPINKSHLFHSQNLHAGVVELLVFGVVLLLLTRWRGGWWSPARGDFPIAAPDTAS